MISWCSRELLMVPMSLYSIVEVSMPKFSIMAKASSVSIARVLSLARETTLTSSVVCQVPTQDNPIFNNSRICLQFEQGARQGILVVDRGYGCKPFSITPVLNPTTSAEDAYSAAHIVVRNVVEQTFGCWKK